jgi:dnd system-associated protein 4
MERRIAPPGTAELLQLLEKLVSPSQGREEGLFRSKQKALMFSAALGWNLKQRKPLERRGEPIRYSIFEGALDDAFINALAIAETNDLKILGGERDDDRVKIFEEYAHGGLLEIKRILSQPGEDLDHLLQAVIDARESTVPPEGLAPDLARLFGA